MIVFVYGSDTYRSHAYLHKMIDKFRAERDPAGYNTIMLDCLAKDDISRLVSEIYAAPFLAEKRMVIAKYLISSKETSIKQELIQRISSGSIPESTVLVIYEIEDSFKAKLDKELFDLLLKEKYKEHFRKLEEAELRAWVQQEISARGGTIERNALEYMVANCGSDTWEIHNIICQLVAYAGALTDAASAALLLKSGTEHAPESASGPSKIPPISLETVKIFVPESVDDNIFNLVDAIVAGQKQKSFGMIRAQYAAGNDSGYVYSMILRQFKILLQIKDAQMRGLQPDAKKLGIHPFVLKKTMPVVGKYSFEQLKNAYQKLLEIDIQTKTGQGDQSLLLDLFVGSLA